MKSHNQSLQLTVVSLRGTTASELGRYKTMYKGYWDAYDIKYRPKTKAKSKFQF